VNLHRQLWPGGFSGTRGWDETNQYSINGVSGLYNQFTLNGAPTSPNKPALTRASGKFAPNVDAVHEFKVMTNTYDAQYGRAGGGTINTIIKNGTKDFHGTAFDFCAMTFWMPILSSSTRRTFPGNATTSTNSEAHSAGPFPSWAKTLSSFSAFEGWREILAERFGQETRRLPMCGREPMAQVDFRSFLPAN